MQSLPEREQAILERWKKHKVFEQTLERTKNGPRFVFYEGPPYANGQPGLHHVPSRAYKDAVARYKTMRGFYVLRRAGWDTHGLPVEMYVEKKLGLKSKREIEEQYGVAKFVEECRKNVFLMKSEWEAFTERMGYWLDFEKAYVTLTPEYIESCWWIFSEIEKRGLLYQDFRVAPLCTRCGTVLSSHEMAQGYKVVKDTSVYVKFLVTNSELRIKKGDYILSWTTTPWTLPGNVGLAVGEDVTYVRVQVDKEVYVLAKALLEKVFPDSGQQILDEFKGKDIVGVQYAPLFPGAIPEQTEGYANAFKVYPADFVTTEDGTGVVHTAVMYGEDDYKLGTAVGLPKHHTVTREGKFIDDVQDVAGMYVKAKKTEEQILQHLEKHNQLLRQEDYEHDYPHCWRCGTPLLYYAMHSWFFKTTAVKEQLLAANQGINWVPDYIKEGRMGEWLENVQDWAISRERYWGVPLPIWVCEKDAGHRTVISSFAELRVRAASEVPTDLDPHRPVVDAITLQCDQCDGMMQRVPDVADVWFDSGSMPLAQWHYPFENKKLIDSGEQYPADFISEGIDQTRGWFYTLLAVAALLGREVPYKNVISLGLVNDAEGKKMSKSVGNIIAPADLFAKYGADATRFYLYTMSQAGDFKNFDEKLLDMVVKKVFTIFANVVSFYTMHTSARPKELTGTQHVLDRWVMARLQQVTDKVTAAMEAYDLTTAGRSIADFITELSTWYVRRSRDRFREDGSDKEAAQGTLYAVLERVCVLLAPFSPMLADAFYQEIQGPEDSVHFVSWPDAKSDIDEAVLKSMQHVRAIVETAHALRAEAGIKVRQPLGQLVAQGEQLQPEFTELIQDEVNVREVLYKSQLPNGKEWKQKDSNGLQVALDTTITDELQEAGWIRELARQINDERKKMGLDRTDKITVQYQTEDATVQGLFERYADELKSAVLAEKLEEVDKLENGKEVKLDEFVVKMALVKK